VNDEPLQLRRQLAADLAAKRAIRSPEWWDAYARVPRHVLVPRFHLEHEDRTLDSSMPGQYDEWLRTVYSDVPLITDRGDDGSSLSSSSTPSIMAMMLEALDVRPGHRVLEVGTGTGYNAALLCERVGCEVITTVDLDPMLVAVARERLAEAGYEPTMLVADGHHGWPDGAPYDRVIGTCFVWPLPPAWIRQTRPGGRVVAVVPNGLVTLTVSDDGSASGPFHPNDFGFMHMRGGHMPARIPRAEVAGLLGSEGERRRCRRPARIIEAGSHWSFWFFHGLFAPFVEVVWHSLNSCSVMDPIDRSWCTLDLDSDEVVQGGPHRLWDRVEERFGIWCELGAPNRERLGLTVAADDQHRLWLGRPDSETAWDLWSGHRALP
jgi:protein-L-isoaspartate O-methyltransferase